MKIRLASAVILFALAIGGCTASVDIADGLRQSGDDLFLYEGPEIEAVVRTGQADRDLGENWLLLALQIRATPGVGIVTIDRSAISVRMPDGRQLPLISQEEFRKNYGDLHARARRAQLSAPPKAPWDNGLRRCDRWLFVAPAEGFATDELHLDSFEYCYGPLVFMVPGGIQPGRWRLIIELEESRLDIPFEVEEVVSY
jgi:hypothetical protein